MSNTSKREHHFYLGSLMNGTAIIFGITSAAPIQRIHHYMRNHQLDPAMFDDEIYYKSILSRTNKTILKHEGRFRQALQDMGYGLHPRGSGQPMEMARIALDDAIRISRSLWRQSCELSWNDRFADDKVVADNVVRIAA